MPTNFEKYIQDSQPTGLSKRDIYNSQEMLLMLSALNGSVDKNIKSGMFEEDMLTELKDIKALLKKDLSKAVARSNAYAPTVAAMNAGVKDSSNLPVVPQESFDWLTEKMITNPAILQHNLNVIKRLWGSSPANGFSEDKPMTETSPKRTVSTPESEGVKNKRDDYTAWQRLTDHSAPQKPQSKRSVLEPEIRASLSQAFSAIKWMGAPMEPYYDIMKTMWDFAKPLRSVASASVGTGVEAAKYLGRGTIGVIDNAWKDAQASRKKNKEGSGGLEETKTSAVEANPTQLKPASLEFPKDISINNFGEFEEWLEVWLGQLLEQKLFTEEQLLDCVKELLYKSDAHLALLHFIAEKFDLSALQSRVYEAGVENVAALPVMKGAARVLALPVHKPEEDGTSVVAVPKPYEEAYSESVGNILAIEGSPSIQRVQPSATPMWDAVSNYHGGREIEDVEWESVSDSNVKAEEEKDARDELMEGTKEYFKTLNDTLLEMKAEAKVEADQTQEVLENIGDEKKKDGGFFSTFLSSLVGGFSSLISGFTSFFNPALITGLGALVAYFSSDGFRKFVNGMGSFVWDKAKNFFDRDNRNSMMNESRAQGAGATALAHGAIYGLDKGAQAAGNAAMNAGNTSKALGRLANIQKLQGVSNASTRTAQIGQKALQGGAKVLQGVAKLSKTPFSMVTKRLPMVGAVLEVGGHALDWAGFDAEGREVALSESGAYNQMFEGRDFSNSIIDVKFAEQAGADNLTWWDYLGKVGGGSISGAGVGAVMGAGAFSLPGAVIGGVIGGLGSLWSMSAEAKHDYRKFAKENPQAFLNFIAAKRSGIALDRIDFSSAKGKGTAGFVKFLMDNKWDIDRMMRYSPESKTGVINSMRLIWEAAKQDPTKEIKDLPLQKLAMSTLSLVSSEPVYNNKGHISDLKVNVSPIPVAGMGTFGDIVQDAIVGDWLRSDKAEARRLTKKLAEVGDDPNYNAFSDWSVPSAVFDGYKGSTGGIRERAGLSKANSDVNLEKVTNPHIITFTNNLPVDTVITSGYRSPANQQEVMNFYGQRLSNASPTRSPHVSGNAVDLKYTSTLASYLASEAGFAHLKANNIDPAFLWAEVDVAGRHFHVQRRQPNAINNLFYGADGWKRYKAYASLRMARASRGEVGSKYKDDQKAVMSNFPTFVGRDLTTLDGKRNQAMDFFISKGLSIKQAAGIAGNLMRESSFNPKAQRANDAGQGFHSVGIAQWNKTRLENLQKFASGRGKSAFDYNTQLEFIWHELSEGTHKSVLPKLQASSSVRDAAIVFGRYYEIPQGHKELETNEEGRIRISHADTALAMYTGFSGYDGSYYADGGSGAEVQGGDKFGTGWWSGITEGVRSLGSIFGVADLLKKEDTASGDDEFYGQPTPSVVTASPMRSEASPSAAPTRLQTPALDVAALTNDDTKPSGGRVSGGSVVNAPSSSQTVYNNTSVNSKSNLYTKQS